jgi:hypothetical protein
MHNSHTHCQVTQANTHIKTWQRVCLHKRITNRQSIRKTEGQQPTAVWRNSGFSVSYESYVVGSSAVHLLNICAINPATTLSGEPL